jgi:Matrixin
MLNMGAPNAWSREQFEAMLAIPGVIASLNPTVLGNSLSVNALLNLTVGQIAQLTGVQWQGILNNPTLSKVVFNAGRGAGYWSLAQLQAVSSAAIPHMTQDQYLQFEDGLVMFSQAQQDAMTRNVALLVIMLTGRTDGWTQDQIARVVNTVPGMIPLSGLPGGMENGHPNPNQGVGQQHQLNYETTTNIAAIKAALSSASWSTLSAGNQAALLSNPALPGAFANLSSRERVDILGNQALISRLTGNNLISFVRYLYVSVTKEQYEDLRGNGRAPVLTEEQIHILISTRDENVMHVLDQFAESMHNAFGTHVISPRNFIALLDENTPRGIEILHTVALFSPAAFADGLITAHVISRLGQDRLLGMGILTALMRYAPAAFTEGVITSEVITFLTEGLISERYAALMSQLRNAPRAFANGCLTQVQVDNLINNRYGIDRIPGLALQYAFIQRAPTALPSTMNQQAVYSEFRNRLRDLDEGGMSYLLGYQALLIEMLLPEEVNAVVNNANFMTAIDEMSRAEMTSFLGAGGILLSQLRLAVVERIVSNARFIPAIDRMDTAQLSSFLGSGGILLHALSFRAQQAFVQEGVPPQIAFATLHSIITNPRFNAAFAALNPEQIRAFLTTSGFFTTYLVRVEQIYGPADLAITNVRAMVNAANFVDAITGMSYAQQRNFFANDGLEFISQSGALGAILRMLSAEALNLIAMLDTRGLDFLNLIAARAQSINLDPVAIAGLTTDSATRLITDPGGLVFLDSLSHIQIEAIAPAIIVAMITAPEDRGTVPSQLVPAIWESITPAQLEAIYASWIGLTPSQRAVLLSVPIFLENPDPRVLNNLSAAEASLLPINFWQQVTTPQLRALLANNNLFANFLQNPGQLNRITLVNLQAIPTGVLIELGNQASPNAYSFLNSGWAFFTHAQQSGLREGGFIPPNIQNGLAGNHLLIDQQPSLGQGEVATGATWDKGSTVTVSAAEFSAAQKQSLLGVLDQYAALTGLSFQMVDTGGQIDLGFDNLGTLSTGVVGLTTIHEDQGHMQSAQIVLENPAEDPLDANGIYGGTQASFTQVLMHELGHALGLADNNVAGSIENFYLDSSNQTLNDYDVQALQALYGTAASAPVAKDSHGATLTTSALLNQLKQAMASASSDVGAMPSTGSYYTNPYVQSSLTVSAPSR